MFGGHLWTAGTPLVQIVFRTVVVYVIVLVGFRLTGKREIGQLTPFDLVLVLLIANAVQNAMVGPDNSLTGGVLAAVVLLLLNWLLGVLADRIPWLQRYAVGEATLLAQNGKELKDNMRREGVTEDELQAAIREHGLPDLSKVLAAWLEIDGTISIIGADQRVHRRRRRVRQFKRGV